MRVIMFGCYNLETKNIIDALTCGAEAFGVQATPREYLTSRNLLLFDIYFNCAYT
jgi:hypothetical protein